MLTKNKQASKQKLLWRKNKIGQFEKVHLERRDEYPAHRSKNANKRHIRFKDPPQVPVSREVRKSFAKIERDSISTSDILRKSIRNNFKFRLAGTDMELCNKNEERFVIHFYSLICVFIEKVFHQRAALAKWVRQWKQATGAGIPFPNFYFLALENCFTHT